jgi:hypothetical protein
VTAENSRGRNASLALQYANNPVLLMYHVTRKGTGNYLILKKIGLENRQGAP